MRKKIPLLVLVFSFSLLSSLTCKATFQEKGAGGTTAGKGRLQAMIADLERSKNPDAKRLAKKMKFFARDMKSEGKDIRLLQPYLNRVEASARAGDFEAADRALMDAVNEAYNVELWREVRFKSVDGFTVYGYLSKPKGREKFPIIVLVHGGEHGSATSYQRHAFRFVKNGFASLAVDYRGSSGHGESYKNAADFAGKEIDDVVKAVEYAHGHPSTTRVGLMGSSHGAFIGGNVLTRSSLVTAANLNFGGYDFRTLFEGWAKSSDPVAQKKIEIWGPILGYPDNPDYTRAEEVSPIYNVDKIDTPLLLIHGKNDKVLPYTESVNFSEALKKEKKKVFLKLYADEPHGFIFRNTGEAESAFRSTESFFKRHLR